MFVSTWISINIPFFIKIPNIFDRAAPKNTIARILLKRQQSGIKKKRNPVSKEKQKEITERAKLKRHKKKEEVQKWLRMEEENAEQLQLAPIVLASLKNINKRNVIDDIGCSDSSVGKVAKAYGGGTDHQRLNGT
jgi:hypothetical protein